MVPGWNWVDILPELTRRAVSYIEDAASASPRTPFFLYFPLTAPHYPVVPAAEFQGKSGAGDYGDFVVQVDWTVGQVLDALARSGLADNTLVIFTSDNGPEITGEVKTGVYDRAQQYRHYSMGALRGAKRDAWEGGHRVPFLARWPGKIAAGSVSGETIVPRRLDGDRRRDARRQAARECRRGQLQPAPPAARHEGRHADPRSDRSSQLPRASSPSAKGTGC